MTTCAVKWCGKSSRASSYEKDGITFHRFPKCPERKIKWINTTSRGEEWMPTNSVICSRHFTEDNFHIMKNRRRLMDSALPTLYLPVLTHILSSPSSAVNLSEPTIVNNVSSTPTMKRRHKMALATTPSAYNSPIKKRLCRRIIELKNSVESKNVQLRKLRDLNRRLKRQIISLKSMLTELEKKT